jgi:hypothetical protein
LLFLDRAYCNAFTSQDDVSLYIHTNLQGKFDRMGTILEAIEFYIQYDVLGRTKHR